MATFIFIISYIVYIYMFTTLSHLYFIPLWLVLAWLPAFLTMLIVYLLHMPLVLTLRSDHPYKTYLMRSLSFFLNHFVFRLSVKAEGLEHIPNSGKLIVYANHKSYTDAFAMLEHFPRALTFTPKKSVMEMPIIRTWLKGYRVFPINRKNVRETAKDLEKAVETVKDGHAMLVFPEGSIKNRLDLQVEHMKPGAFKLALKSEATILVCKYEGNDLIRKRTPFKKSVRMLRFFEPIPYETYKDLSTNELAALVMKSINQS